MPGGRGLLYAVDVGAGVVDRIGQPAVGLMLRRGVPREAPAITVVQNWLSEVKNLQTAK